MTSALPQHTAHIGQLNGVRAVAAVFVVTVHYQAVLYGLLPAAEVLHPLVDAGGLGLLMFFTLSGFVISYNYFDRIRDFSGTAYRTFLTARIARMYPVHLFMLLVILVLYLGARTVGVTMPNPEFYRPDSFVASLFMVQGIFTANPWNGPAWTLTLEFVAYLLFPLIVLMLAVFARSSSAFVVAGFVTVAGTAVMMVTYSMTHSEQFGGAISWMHIAVEFMSGCLLYTAWRLGGFGRSLWWDGFVIVGFVAIVSMLFITGGNSLWQFTAIPVLAFMVLGVAASAGPVARILAIRPLFWLGQVSYSLYLSHVTVRALIRQVLPPESFENSGLLVRAAVVTVYFVVAIIIGGLIFHFVEEPGRRKLRRWEKRWEASHEARRAPADSLGLLAGTQVSPLRRLRRIR